MARRTIRITLALALLAGVVSALALLPSRPDPLVRLALGDDPVRRGEAIRQLRQADPRDPQRPLLLRPAILDAYRHRDRLASASPEAFRAVADELDRFGALSPAGVGYPAYERFLLDRLSSADEADLPQRVDWIGAHLLRHVPEARGDRSGLARLASALAASLPPDDADSLHHLLLTFATLAGPGQPSLLAPLLERAIESDDALLARDGVLLMALLRLSEPAPRFAHPSPEVHEALWVWGAMVGELPAHEPPPTHLQALLAQFVVPPAGEDETAAPPLLPPSPEPILELAYWPDPRWQIALRLEEAGEHALAEELLSLFDDHARRAGLLACALLGVAGERIERLARGDDDLTNRRYALLARLIMESDIDGRDRLAEAAIQLAEVGELPADDVLFALLASGSRRGGDWLLDPLTPRRSLAQPPLGWEARLQPPPGRSIWPILQRFLSEALGVPPNVSEDEAATRLHADVLRLAYLLHRDSLDFDRDVRRFRSAAQ